MRVLVIGSGGREHALCWKLKQSEKLTRLYAAPGNPGMAELAECFPVPTTDLEGLLALSKRLEIDLTVVGPEDPLAAGIVDLFEGAGMKIFGPSRRAAEIESSKMFALDLMHRHGIPTADYATFTDSRSAEAYLALKDPPIVVKVDGLAAGKGAIVCCTINEAKQTVHRILDQGDFGSAGNTLVIMDYLEGEEASIFAITDGEEVAILAPAQDHKRVFDGDKGPNTGGMGAYAPTPIVSEDVMSDVKKRIILPTLRALKADGRLYKGVLYAGIILTVDGPKVIEFNCRFGDPETQVVLPILEEDLLDISMAVLENRVKDIRLSPPRRGAACVVAASEGYPGDYPKGRVISGLDEVSKIGETFVFHAATSRSRSQISTAGGRVLGLSARASDLPSAIAKTYEAIQHIHFEGMYYRRDIGRRALKRLSGNK